ncbi:MAG: glutamate-5-semialdehyde dehydrogenase [Chloroflexi bacterium]|nr:glutamate-5-semialdehyde dehydrogenase [Chloroflexota bacterium]
MATTTSELITKAKAARAATRDLRNLSTDKKNAALEAIAVALETQQTAILEANALDMEAGASAGLTDALLDRLMLNEDRLNGMASDVRTIVRLPDPIGETFDGRTLDNGLRVERRRVPLGVIGTIYESRPNVTVDIAALCLKSGNAVVLRGGKEAVHSNNALAALLRSALTQAGINPEIVQQIVDTDRAVVEQMIKANDYIDLIIPRGGAGLVNYVAKEATVPAITGGIGVVHTFADATADVENAVDIVFNSKVQRPTVCNALDTLLVAPKLLPLVAAKLSAAGVELRCDQRALSLIGPVYGDSVKAATAEDFGQEFLALVLSVRVVDSLDEALEHIEEHGSGHTETILTQDYTSTNRFLDEVDAAMVMVNASTRFNDGAQLGLGAEVAISTNKLHARGPMGLRELTSYKWVARGDGQVRR